MQWLRLHFGQIIDAPSQRRNRVDNGGSIVLIAHADAVPAQGSGEAAAAAGIALQAADLRRLGSLGISEAGLVADI